MPKLTETAKAIIDDFAAKIREQWKPARSIPREWKNYLLKQLLPTEKRNREFPPRAVDVCLRILWATVNNDTRPAWSKTSPHRSREVSYDCCLTEAEKNAIAARCGVSVRTVERWNNRINTYFAYKELPLSHKGVVLEAAGRFIGGRLIAKLRHIPDES